MQNEPVTAGSAQWPSSYAAARRCGLAITLFGRRLDILCSIFRRFLPSATFALCVRWQTRFSRDLVLTMKPCDFTDSAPIFNSGGRDPSRLKQTTFQIQIILLLGKTLLLWVQASFSVRQLLKILEQRLGIPSLFLRLLSADDFTAFLSTAVEAAKLAGEMISKNFHLQDKVVDSKGQVDLVTETDKACEKIIFQRLQQKYPDHQFIGEETSAANGTADLTDAPTWIIDPLDGTTNFVHRFPFVCVSIALTIGKIPTVGVVYNPILGELFTAIRGRGSFLNATPISCMWTSIFSIRNDKGSSCNWDIFKYPALGAKPKYMDFKFGTKRDKATVDANTDRFKGLLFKVRSVRMTGSCALNLCGVACGRLDLFYHLGYGGLWDVAAGVLIVQEAGGCVFDPSGADFNITSQRVAATNAHLKGALVDALRGKV